MGAAAACGAAVLAIGSLIGWPLAFTLCGLLLGLVAYYGVILIWLRRGRFHPVVAWMNVAIEVSIPAVFLVLDVQFKGPEYAATAPPLAIWGGLIVLSGLRAQRSLALTAGALAAVEYFGLYWFLIHPAMPTDALVTLSWPLMAVRAFLLMCCGALTATVAESLIRKAEQALQAVRQRDVFGKYMLHERIGSGGMAEVFRATYCPEGGFEKEVAVKRILPAYADDQEFLALFQQEAATCSQLSHPNVVQVFDMGRFNGSYYLSMEFVRGLTLRQLLARLGPLPVPVVAYVGAEMANALDYLHSRSTREGGRGLVHRDLNPPNILLSVDGDAKLTDFGIARAIQGRFVQATAHAPGKLGYMPPEQAAGSVLDGRADLYALGVTLYEALLGQHPMRGALEGQFPPPVMEPVAKRLPDLPAALTSALDGVLRSDAAQRTRTARELREALMQIPLPNAPYPTGQKALADAVQRAMERGGPPDGMTSATTISGATTVR